jgi:hypothetical protein
MRMDGNVLFQRNWANSGEPGRKDDPCPYATLAMLKMLSQFDEWKNSKETHAGAECLLGLWKKSSELHPYMFYMGTDF